MGELKTRSNKNKLMAKTIETTCNQRHQVRDAERRRPRSRIAMSVLTSEIEGDRIAETANPLVNSCAGPRAGRRALSTYSINQGVMGRASSKRQYGTKSESSCFIFLC